MNHTEQDNIPFIFVKKHNNDHKSRLRADKVSLVYLWELSALSYMFPPGCSSSSIANSMAAHMALCVFGRYHTAKYTLQQLAG